MQAAISIGLPTYNNSETITETIQSLIAQTFKDWECFVIDDSELSDTFIAAQSAIGTDSRFTLVKNEARLGAAGNWNKTLDLANGEYFKLLCGDDVLNPNALAEEIGILESYNSASMSFGRRDIINSSGRVILRNRGIRNTHALISGQDAIRKFLRTGTNFFGEPSFVLFRTKILKKVNGFDSGWKYLIDVESYISVLCHGDLANVNSNLGAFRISGKSWSANLARSQRTETFQAIDFAKSNCLQKVYPWDSGVGKIRAMLNTVARRLIFRFLA